ncbi:MAG: hypothetical protein KF853_06035 [Rhodocyclaceae bacterium]|nr:hypothetical protein [Rhodocyclaceae bacterium]
MIEKILLLTVAVLLSGCVNLHVHFPDAADKTAGGEVPTRPADAGGAAK